MSIQVKELGTRALGGDETVLQALVLWAEGFISYPTSESGRELLTKRAALARVRDKNQIWVPRDTRAELLAVDPEPLTLAVTQNLMVSTVAWALSEGGSEQDQLGWPTNPLDCGQPWPGSEPLNSANVQAYPNIQDGYAAAWQNLNVGDYGYAEITTDYNADDVPLTICTAISASQWGSFRDDNYNPYPTSTIEAIIDEAIPIVAQYWNVPPPEPTMNFCYLVRDIVNTKGVWLVSYDFTTKRGVQSEGDLNTFVEQGQAKIVAGFTEAQLSTALQVGARPVTLNDETLEKYWPEPKPAKQAA